MSDTTNWVKITREFDAPIDQVWAMWTNPDEFRQWYGPNGMSVPSAEMDLRVGGQRRTSMSMETPDQTMTMYFTGVFKEISPPNRLVYTESMCDADGVLIPPSAMGMPDGHPEVTEVIVELRDIGGRTEMTMVHVGVPDGSPGAGDWNQAFDKLAAHLARAN